MASRDVGSFTDGGADLKFGPAELLYLEDMLVARFVVVIRGRVELNPGVAQIDVFGQVKLEVEAAQGADCGFVRVNQVIRRIAHRILEHGGRAFRQQADVALRTAPDLTHPAFDADGFAGTVDFAVVKDKVADVGALGALPPSVPTDLSSVVFVAVFGQEGCVIAVAGNEQLGPAAGQTQPN